MQAQVVVKMQERSRLLHSWLQASVAQPLQRIIPLAGDASLRRYFRVYCGDTSYVAMDASSEKQSCQAFIAIAKAFRALGLNVPRVYAADVDNGFLLLTDFGDQLYLNALNNSTCHHLYQNACDDLLLIHSCRRIEGYTLPHYEAALYREEMLLFSDWYLQKLLHLPLTQTELMMLDNVYSLLIEDALSQPQVCVHRDYHSRNLMVLNKGKQPAILDFQDAVWGPITYDLVSLLRDCYIDWPATQVEQWVLAFHQQALQAGILQRDNPQLFLRWFEWIGLQRNLKCIGLFARLSQRDNKITYLRYIPRVINYAQQVCERYAEFAGLKTLLVKINEEIS